MTTELLTNPIPHELPAAEITAKVTTCKNRFEIVVNPGQELTSWDNWLLQGKLSMWLESRMDSINTGGHNPNNPTP